MAILDSLVRLAEPWASVFADTPALQTATTFMHFGGFLLGGGFAIAADGATIRAARRIDRKRRLQLAHIHAIHRVVLAGLSLTLVSGVLLFAADVETYAVSLVFWAKMGLVVLLLANGGVMALTESALRAGYAQPDAGWRRMRLSAVSSFVLWFAAVLAGTLLVNPGG